MASALPNLANQDLEVLELLGTPIWLFHAHQNRIVWANSSGLRFWFADDLESLRSRTFSGMSAAARGRLDMLIERITRGGVAEAQFTFYPDGIPTPVRLTNRGVYSPQLSDGLLILNEAHRLEADELSARRAVDVLSSIPAGTGLFARDGTPLWENQASLSAFHSRTDGPVLLPDRFADRSVADDVQHLVACGHTFTGEVELDTVYGRRWHLIDVRAMTDCASGDPVVMLVQTDIHRWKTAELDLREAKELAEHANRSKSEFLANMSHEIRTPMNGVLGALDLLARSELDDVQQRLLNTIQRSARTLLEVLNDILDLSRIEAGKLKLSPTDFNLEETFRDVVALHQENAQKKGLELGLEFEPHLPTTAVGDPVRLSQVLGNLLSNAIKFTEFGSVRVSAELQESSAEEVVVCVSVSDTGCGISDAAQQRVFSAFEQADGSTTRRYGGTGLGLTISRRLVELMGGDLGLESALNIGSKFWFTLRLGLRGHQGQTVDISPKTNLLGARAWIFGRNPEMVGPFTVALTHAGVAVRMYDDLTGLHDAPPCMDPDLYIVDLDEIDPSELPQLDDGPRILGWSQKGEKRPREVHGLLIGTATEQGLIDCVSRLLGQRFLVPAEAVNEADASSRLRAARILLVEDNIVNQEVAVSMLETFECHVTCADHGAAALEAYGEHRFDVILMDCQMPVMDGFTATRAIRQVEEEKNNESTPIIALTANAMTGDRERCLDAGMNDFLAKPFSLEQLAEKLETWVRP